MNTEYNFEVGIVILNYNDAETAISLYKKIKNYKDITHIVITDNCSTDNSWERLKEACDCDLIRTDKNDGYSTGNNIGTRYLIEKYSCKYVIIANPDVIFSEGFVVNVVNALEEHPSIGIMSGVMHDRNNEVVKAAYGYTPSFFQALLECFYFYRYYVMHKKTARINYDKQIMPVEVIWGSLFIMSAEAYMLMDGFDEGTFLYHEENIIARRIQKIGKTEAILTSESYLHMHGVSTGKQTNRVKRHVMGLRSQYYFQCKYNELDKVQRSVLRVFMKYSEIEMKIINCCLALMGK